MNETPSLTHLILKYKFIEVIMARKPIEIAGTT